MLNQLKQALMLPQFALGVAETAMNALLARSPQTQPILRKLAGKILELKLNRPDFSLFLLFSETRCDWLGNYEAEPDCRVSLSLDTLPKLADKSQLAALINCQALRLEGDIQVLQQFSALLDELERDPAELLSPLLGDVLAQGVSELGGQLFQRAKTHAARQQQHWVDNLMNERPVLVHRLQAVHFYDQIAELTQQLDALEQRIAAIE